MSSTAKTIESRQLEQVLTQVHQALQDLRFGAIEIVVHNGHVVQIERKEKFRLSPTSSTD